jgi:hypothetical protein
VVGESAAATRVDEPDEIAEERRIDALAALVCSDPGELEQLVDVLLRQVERRGIFTGRRRQSIARLCEPIVHGVSLVPRASGTHRSYRAKSKSGADAGSPRIDRDTGATVDIV